MAVTQFAFGRVGPTGPQGDSLPFLIVNAETVVEAETPGGATVATTATAPDFGSGRSLVRVATDTAVYVSFGTAPNAQTDAVRFYLSAGMTEYFGIAAGWKAAVVAA